MCLRQSVIELKIWRGNENYCIISLLGEADSSL